MNSLPTCALTNAAPVGSNRRRLAVDADPVSVMAPTLRLQRIDEREPEPHRQDHGAHKIRQRAAASAGAGSSRASPWRPLPSRTRSDERFEPSDEKPARQGNPQPRARQRQARRHTKPQTHQDNGCKSHGVPLTFVWSHRQRRLATGVSFLFTSPLVSRPTEGVMGRLKDPSRVPLRTAIVSDLHANLPATEAVFERIAKADVQRIVCLGDVVGYGEPEREVCDIVQAHVDHYGGGQSRRRERPNGLLKLLPGSERGA